ncbi:MAG TPA: carboxypeptidase regulatory-like domain-containing protein [Vicinamibacterales bacterium]|nr:carboxypeptidase regulatory-like domain-containing protein [Vicinamibacterales bacterium]
MRPTDYVSTAVLATVLFAVAAAPATAQGVGAIGGTVMDGSGAVLPGATVTLTSAQGTVGGNQETVSDARGAYQFLRLVPGGYSVKATMQGFRPVEQRNISVNADNTARADLTLPIGGLEEGIVVSGEAPLLDTTSALRQTVMTQETLQALPNRVDMWSITRAVPSIVVSKVDVGGSESFQQSGVTVHGTDNEGAYLVDGMDVSQNDGTGNGATFYLDPFAYSETNFLAGNGPAEAARGGLVFNVITRTGTNQVHGGAQFNGTNHTMAFANTSAALRAQILRTLPAKILAINPNISPGADIRYLYDSGAWLAGPIAHDKLWYSTSFHHQAILQHDLGSYNPDGTQVPDDNFLWNASNKVAWQMSQTSQLSYFYTLQHKVNGHRASTTMFVESGATTRNSKLPQLHQLKWTSSLNAKTVADLSLSVDRNRDWFSPPIGTPTNAIPGFDILTNTLLRVLDPSAYRDQQNRRTVAQASVSYFTAVHDIKVGVQLDQMNWAPINYSTSNMRAVYRNGVPDSVNTFNSPTYADMKDREIALYVQDRWRPARRLTLNLGLRIDNNYGWENAACQAPNEFVGAQCYPPLKGFPDWTSLNPRFSAIYDLAGDGKTALKFAANRYIVGVGASIVNRVNPIAIASDMRAWTACAPGQTSACDLNGDGLPQINELGPSSGYNFGASQRYASGTKWPWAREYTVELQRELPGNLLTTVGYTRREKLGNIGYRNMAVPMSSYIPVTVTEVNSGRSVTVYNQDPALRGKIDILWNNETALDSTYNGADFTLEKRLSNHWMTTGGVSIGKNVGDIYPTPTTALIVNDLNNPNMTFRRGIAGSDVPFSLRLSGLYELPYGVSASATFQHQTGFPEITTVSVGNNTIALTQGGTSIAIQPRATTRLPSLNQVDVSLRKALRTRSTTFQPRIDVYNLANSATVLSRATVLGSSYGAVNSIQRGRLIKLGFSVDF